MITGTLNKLLDKLFNDTDFSQPTTLYLALHTADPSGTGANEVSGGDYARQEITFSNASSGAIVSNIDAKFDGLPEATLTHASIWDASSNGNIWWESALSSQTTVDSGDSYKIPAGAIDISLT